MNRSSDDDNNIFLRSKRYYDSPENDNYELMKHLASHVGRRPTWFDPAKFECGKEFLKIIQRKTLYDPELNRDNAKDSADATIGDGGIQQELTAAADIKPQVGKPRRSNVIFAPEPRKPTFVLVADGMITKVYESLMNYEERHQILPPKA